MTARNEHLRTVTSNDGAAILDVERGLITTLNATGAYVWERLQRSEPIDEIVTSLARDTGHDCTIVRRDVQAFLHQLDISELMETSNQAATRSI